MPPPVRYMQQHNCIVNLETHATWCVRSTLVINMVIGWSLQATCLETGRRTAAPVEFGRPSVFEPAELPLSGTGRLTAVKTMLQQFGHDSARHLPEKWPACACVWLYSLLQV